MSIENPAEWKLREKWEKVSYIDNFPQISVCSTEEEDEERDVTEEEKRLAEQLGMIPIIESGMNQDDAIWVKKYLNAFYAKKITDIDFEILRVPNIWQPFFRLYRGHGSSIVARWGLVECFGKDIED